MSGWILVGFAVLFVLSIIGYNLIGGIEGAGTGAFAGLLLMLFIFYPVGKASYNERVVSCQVEDKDRGGDNGSYRVYTKDCGVLANGDQWFRGKTNSADIWNQIEKGKRYNFHVVGWRFELFSDFPNILEVK